MSIGYQPPTNARPSDRTTSRPYARRESLQNLDTVPTPTHPDALHYFGVLYAGLRGWCELSWIIGDPAQKDGHSYHKEWHEVTTEYTTLATRCATLAALYGNVYVSRTLYSERRRSVDCAVPSRVIFVDDLPVAPALAPSMVIQTSAKSRHGYYLTTEPLANADGNELARRGAAALGCDRSGADITQIVRVPGTFNTKGGGRFPVQLVTSGGPIYHADALRAAWPELATPDVAPLKLNNQRVEWFLGNINTLLDTEGIPRRVRNPKARALFAKQWRDTSAYRYTIAKSLVMHGFPDDEAAAILIYLCEPASARKGGAWLVTDTQRCLVKARSKTPPRDGIRATTLSKKYQAQLPQALPAQPPQRVGRPTRATADTLLAFYQAHADTATHCLMKRAAVCSALNIGGTTVARLEKELTQGGAIHRQTATNRRTSWIVFGVKPDDLGIAKITKNTPENAPTPNNFGNTPMPLESHEAEAGITKEHTAPVAPRAVAVFPPLAQPSAGVCSSKTTPASTPPAAEPTPNNDPQPARPSPIYGPKAAALAILIDTPGYLEFKQAQSARPPMQPKPDTRLVPQAKVPSPTVAARPSVLLHLPNPSHAQRQKRRNLSAVPFSALRDDETIAHAYDRLFGAG